MKIPIPEIEMLSEESKHLYDVINEESDLACVLIGTSYLDHALASLLKRYFIVSNVVPKVLEPPRGALSTFASRYDTAYCLGLISKGLYRNLEIVGQIRNAFAHRYLSVNLDDTEITTLVEKLTFPKVAGSITIDEKGEQHIGQDPFLGFTQPRDKFNTIIVMMVNQILMNGRATQHKPSPSDSW